MITRAIVEEIVSPYQVKIRIPLFDRAESSPMSRKKEDLNIATICSLPNCYVNIQVGDVVFVGFEDNTYYKAVVLGHLSREAMTETYADVTFGNLVSRATALLPQETTIGNVTPLEISRLSGVSENIQSQIDSLKQDIQAICDSLYGGNA